MNLPRPFFTTPSTSSPGSLASLGGDTDGRRRLGRGDRLSARARRLGGGDGGVSRPRSRLGDPRVLAGGVDDRRPCRGGVTVGERDRDRDLLILLSEGVGVRDCDLPRDGWGGGPARRRGGGDGEGDGVRRGAS